MKRIDRLGEKHNRWTIIDISIKPNYYVCKCECGTIKEVLNSNLLENKSMSCGCLSKQRNRETKLKDLVGQKFGKLIVKKLVGTNSRGTSLWECQCECGNTIIAYSNNLKNGHTKSCGCLKKTVNGLHNHPLCSIYHGMLTRCFTPTNEYKKQNYKDRGISVCDEWLGENGFINFYNWAIANGWNDEKLPSGRHKLTVDRINNDEGYSPSNCRWVTYHVQNLNKRKKRSGINAKQLLSQSIHYERGTSKREQETYILRQLNK